MTFKYINKQTVFYIVAIIFGLFSMISSAIGIDTLNKKEDKSNTEMDNRGFTIFSLILSLGFMGYAIVMLGLTIMNKSKTA
jgi:hypothetical protein